MSTVFRFDFMKLKVIFLGSWPNVSSYLYISGLWKGDIDTSCANGSFELRVAPVNTNRNRDGCAAGRASRSMVFKENLAKAKRNIVQTVYNGRVELEMRSR